VTLIALPPEMAADVRVVWEVLAPALERRGIRLTGKRADAVAALAFGLAMDERLRQKHALVPVSDRAVVERLRARMQEGARASAWVLGLLPIERVKTVPRDADGRDVELWEFAPLDRSVLAATVAELLAALAEDDDDPDEEDWQ
jgi:hypothetical protein